ncbi:MAG: hypothetical protein IJQ66_07125 [Clostridia bacterium]|nr:hypothetical protein [Clostridia bacterium]
MKKKLIGFITVILSAIMVLSGCNLVTTNDKRDLSQVVATVNVNANESVYKKDMVMAYLNYGYIYTQYYGYSAADTYKQIINGLVENRIMVQAAYAEFEENADVEKNAAKQTADPERYLNEEEITDAMYSTRFSVNSLLDSFKEADASKNSDTLIADVRTVPTDANNAEKEVDKAAYNEKPFDLGTDDQARKAFNSFIELLRANDLLGDDYESKGTIESTLYYTELLKSNLENKIIDKYNDLIEKEVYDKVTFEDLEKAFASKLDKQKKWSNAEFVSALSSATASEPILYSAYGVYGYVYNLLIGVNDYQSAMISELQTKRSKNNMSKDEYAAELEEILAATLAKDLRSTWILSGYDFDGEKFTGDYTFAKDPENSLAFSGEVAKLADATEEDNAIYGVKSVYTYGLDEFIEFVNEYVYGENVGNKNDEDPAIYWEFNDDGREVAEYDAKINELLFAFSTDPGSLNTYKGYVIKPKADGSNSEDYVETFGNAGRELLLAGGTSYKVVASDYGYHFMFFSEVFNVGDGFETLTEYLDTLGIDKGDMTWAEYFEAQKEDWDAFEEENNYLYIIANELVSAKLSDTSSKYRTSVINRYRYDEEKVHVYEDRYANLLG